MFSLREGLNLEIRRLFRINNSNVEFEDDETEKSSKAIGWQVSVE